MKSNILDRNWKYVPASRTDIRRTFARIKRELAKQGEKRNVVKLPTKKGQK